MDGAFQRVSPGQIEKAVAPFTHAGFMSADLRTGLQRGRGTGALGGPCPGPAAFPQQSARYRRRGDRGGALGRLGTAQYTGRAVRPGGDARAGGTNRASPDPRGSQFQVAQRYLSAQGRMLEAGMRIAALRLDERGAWEMDLDSGVTVRLGRRDVDARLDRFIRTRPR